MIRKVKSKGLSLVVSVFGALVAAGDVGAVAGCVVAGGCAAGVVDDGCVGVVGVAAGVVVAGMVAAAIDTEYAITAVNELESVAWTVKLYAPAVVGVPVIAPVLLRESPMGRLPLEIAYEYEPEPPVADIVAE